MLFWYRCHLCSDTALHFYDTCWVWKNKQKTRVSLSLTSHLQRGELFKILPLFRIYRAINRYTEEETRRVEVLSVKQKQPQANEGWFHCYNHTIHRNRHSSRLSYSKHFLLETHVRGYIQKIPDWVDNEIYAYNNKHSLRSNTKGYGGKTH
jgi:hypothetical protein